VNLVIDELREICHRNPFREKILIVDSYYIGNQIVEAYTIQEKLVINLHYKTVNDLAVDFIEAKSLMHGEYVNTVVTRHLIYTILKALKENNDLRYFKDIEVTPTFSQAVHDTIMQLRLAGYDSDTLNASAFLSEEKGTDIKHILAHYEQSLVSRNLMDQASVLKAALEVVPPHDKCLYILQSNLQLTELERLFLEKLLPEEKYKLPLAKVYGVNLPEASSIASIKWGKALPLSDVYRNNEMSEQIDGVTTLIAKTEELEIKAVLNAIFQRRAKLDCSVIYYSNSEPYIATVYQLCQKMNLPVTFSEGLPINYSRPGKLVAGLLKWLQSRYSVQVFIQLLFEGVFEFIGENAPSKTRIAKRLRDLQIGWGQERYSETLDRSIQVLEDLLKEDKTDRVLIQMNDLKWLKEWFVNVFNVLPVYGQEISYKGLLSGIKSILANQFEARTELDREAKDEIVKQIDGIVSYLDDEVLALYEAVEKTSDLLLTLTIHASNPKSGHLHIASFHNGIYNHREHVFFVGLDDQRFPGKSMEDPLLLDSEREALNGGLSLMRYQSEKKLYNMLQAIAHCTGKVTASYCNFDVTNNRTLNPSYLFLQLYRVANRNINADFKEIKAVYAPIYSEMALEERDFWAGYFMEEKTYHLQGALLEQYPNLKSGMEAEQMRDSDAFTHYDGKVEIDVSVYNPSNNKEKALSASKLEGAASCPYAYFLRDILKLRPIEEAVYDANKWLDAGTRGSLLHGIFEVFLKQLKAAGEKPNFSRHRAALTEVAKRFIQAEREKIAPPSERVFQSEQNDLLQCCDIFLKEEESFYESYEPYDFEYTFGMNGIKPALLTLATGETVHISGKIDRIDQDQAGQYHIIDYKTGSTYGYDERKAFNGGRQLQHLIYALAIEQHLQLEVGTVTESSYYFPSVKGSGSRVVRKQDEAMRTNGIDILTKIIDVMSKGHFTMTDNENDCRFCDYKAVCKRAFYNKERLANKQSDPKYSGLTSFKGVRAYD